ncbi:hypothetical protein T440DRAFT_549884 [Plenodomus tracheiphilus IPT5]|uniref:Uncharacterized protein n=1 Tax=Plenodomus tracheiphilus IPT5 TaxID=1408161 RepID=A0A6A7BQA9_9PLEO|nr:hypothetical protein T440DRAFT_549884 [Plenodomus tracheiphilus IPT5]
MPRGFDQPTSSSASRTTDTGSREQPAQPSTTRTRQGRYEVSAPTQGAGEPKQPQSQRRPTNPASLDISHHSGEPQTSGPTLKTPAYLQGKNPYGQVLANVEHPYREDKVAVGTAVGPPYQMGANVQGRPRGSGAVRDVARSTPAEPEPERTSVAPDSRPPLPPPRQPPKPASVQAAKNFFETKASQSRSAPPFPPASATIIAAGTKAKDPQSSVRFRYQPARPSSPVKPQGPRKGVSYTALQSSNPLTKTEQVDPAHSIDSANQLKSGKSLPEVVVRKATALTVGPPFVDEHSEIEEGQTGPKSRRRSTNIFANAPHEVAHSSFEQEYADDATTTDIKDHSYRPDSRGSSEETVKRRSTRRSSSTTELEASDDPRVLEAPQEPRRSKTAHSSSKIHGERDSPSSRRLRRQSSRSAPLVDMATMKDQEMRSARRRSSKSSATDTAASQLNTGRPSDVRRKIEAIAAKGLSHDGSGSLYSLSRQSTASGPIPTADVGVQDDYHDIEVPHHVDWRGAYGRRKTQDFGFPGARIKPRGTFRPYKPLQDPSSWVKRVCGHFSYMGKGEVPELAIKKRCRQCSVKSASPAKPQQSQSRHSRKQAATNSSSTSSSSSKLSDRSGAQSSRRRKHHSECVPNDKCGDTFAKDLGLIIDAILEEHTSTLQGVINNIRHSQPSLAQLRRVSQDLVQRSQTTGVCTNPRHTPCRPQCVQQTVCQQVCQPGCKPQVCEWSPPCPYVPPKATEKLNVGSPGQIVPNVNDSRADLRESIKSVPELVSLVNSAADDLGLDLDRRPTEMDDELFQNAPYEKTPRASVPSPYAYPSENVEEGLADEDRPVEEDHWLQQTRRHLTELSEARTQLMDELDSIAEDLDVQLQDRRATDAQTDHVQRVLSKVNTGISRRSTRLRNKSVDSVAGEIPKMVDQQINERRLSRVLTRISAQSRRMSAITQNMQDIGDIPPEEIQEWLEVAQTELPAAIDSITTVLETLPALDFESADEQEGQSVYEEEYEPYGLQDRIADLERRLRKESMKATSSEVEENDFVNPLERVLSSTSTKSQSPVHLVAAEDVAEDTAYLPVQSATTRTLTSPSSRRTTLRRQPENEPSVPAERCDSEEIENILQPERPPIVERIGDRRTSKIKSVQPYVQPERTFSFMSPDPSELEQPHYDTPQELAHANSDIPARRLIKRRTSVTSSPVRSMTHGTTPLMSASPEPGPVRRKSSRRASGPSRKPTFVSAPIEPDLLLQGDYHEHVSTIDEQDKGDSFEPPVERIRRSTTIFKSNVPPEYVDSASVTSFIESNVAEEDYSPQPSSKKISRQSTRKASLPEIGLDVSTMNMTRSATQFSRQPTLRQPETGFDPPVLAVAKSPTRESRRPSIGSPPPELEEFVEKLALSPTTTRQPTRSSTTAVMVETPEEDFEAPSTRMRRTITQPPPSPEPEPEPVTRRGTKTTPPLTDVLTRMSTQRRSDSIEEPPAPPSSPSTEAEIVWPFRVVTKPQPQIESMPLQSAARIFPDQSDFAILESSFTSPSEISASQTNEAALRTEVDTPVQVTRQSTTVYEPPSEEVVLEPVFTRRKSSFRSSPSITRPLTGPSRQSTVAERRAPFEDALNVSARRTSILSDPTTTKIPPQLASRANTRQPSIFNRTSTQHVPKPPTRRTTEPEFLPLPVSRQSTMPNDNAPSQRFSTFEGSESVQRNVDESEVEESFAITRQPTRRTPRVEATPMSSSRQTTMRRSRSVSRRSSAYSLLDLSLRNMETLPKDQEANFSRVTTRQPTKINRKPTRKPTEPVAREPEVITRHAMRQRTMLPDPDPVKGEDPAVPVRKERETTETPFSLQLTEIQLEDESLSGLEVTFSSSSSSFEIQPVSSRVASGRDRKVMQVDKSATSQKKPPRSETRRDPVQEPPRSHEADPLTHAEGSSAYSEPDMESNQLGYAPQSTRRVTALRTATPSEPLKSILSEQRTVSRQPTIPRVLTSAVPESLVQHMQQKTELDEVVEPFESELDPTQEVESMKLPRPSTRILEAGRPNVPSRKTTWSTEAVLEEDLSSTALSRKATSVSRQTTRQPTRQLTMVSRQPIIGRGAPSQGFEDSPAEEFPTPVTRASRQSTKTPRHSTVTDDDPPKTILSRQPTHLSRATTIRVGSPSALATIGTFAETSSESEIELEAKVEESTRGSVGVEPMIVTRTLTRIPTQPPRSVENDFEPAVRHDPIRISRQPTRVATITTQRPTQPVSQPDSYIEPTLEHDLRNRSTPSSRSEEPLADYDVYRGTLLNPAGSLPEVPLPVVRKTTTVHAPVTAYPPSPRLTPPQQSAVALSQIELATTGVEESSSEPPLVAETIERELEQPSAIAVEEIPEEEPGRIDRASTAALSRDPESLAPPLARGNMGAPATDQSPLGRRKTRIDPKVDERIPRVLTVPRERDRRRSSAAPGILAPASEEPPKTLRSTLPARKLKKVPNYPPEQQYPPAPAYPPRETPLWTKPDTQTPPPRPKAEELPKKRRFLGFRSKPKDEPVQRPPEPHRDREVVRPFRHAAPGPVPGPPGGTLQRPTGYTNRPGNTIYHRTLTPIPIRRDDYPSRQAPVYARKDDYFPRLTPIACYRRNDHPRPQSAPIRRDVHPQYSRAQAPAHNYYPAAPTERDYPAPNDAPPRRDYPQAQPRAAAYRSEPRQQPLRRYTPKPVRHQPQTQQALRDQERVFPRSNAASSQRRPQDHKEPSRTRTAPPKEDFNGSPRRGAHGVTSEEKAVPEKEDLSKSGQEPIAEEEFRRFPQQDQQGERESSRPTAQEQDTSHRLSRIPEVPSQGTQEQSPEQEPERDYAQQSPIQGSEPSGAESEAKASSEEVSGNDNSSHSSQERRKTPISDSVDGASGRPSLDLERQPSAAGPDLPRATVQHTSTAGRRASTQNQADPRRPSTTRRGQEESLSRAPIHPTTARRASEAATRSQTARKDSSASTRRPSTALERTSTQHRSSNAHANIKRRSTPSRTALSRTTTATTRAPTVSASTGKTVSRRPSTKTAAPVSRTADKRAQGVRSPNSRSRGDASSPPTTKLGSKPQQTAKTTEESAEPVSGPKKPTSPRPTTGELDEPFSGDPAASPPPRSGGKNSFDRQRVSGPTKRTPSFFGRGKGQGESGAAQSAGQGANADSGQRGGKGEAKTRQGAPAKGRWGWGWGKG